MASQIQPQSAGLPKPIQPLEKVLEVELKEDNPEENQKVADFIEEGFKKKMYQDHTVSLKVSLTEQMMEKLGSATFNKMVSPLMMFKDGVCKNLEVINQIKDKSIIKELFLDLKELNLFDNPKIGQNLSEIFKTPLNQLTLTVKIENEAQLKILNESIQTISPSVESLGITVEFHLKNIEEMINCKIFGENLDNLKNLKNLRIHLMNFEKLNQLDFFKGFFLSLKDMKNLECLEIILEKLSLNEETYEAMFKNFYGDFLPKLKMLSLRFVSISDLNSSPSLANFLSELHKTNLIWFDLDFKGIKSTPETYLKFLEKVEINEKIQYLGFGLNEFDLLAQYLSEIKNYLCKFPNLIKLELSITTTPMDNLMADKFVEIIKLENVQKLEYLRLILGYNKIQDEFGKKLFAALQTLISLKYFFLDLQQNWSGSFYLNDTIHNFVTDMIAGLKNLKSCLFNFDGNELKRDGNGYKKIEEKVAEIKKNDPNLFVHFKLIEKFEIENDNKFNPKCHLPHENFFNEFYKEHNLFRLNFGVFSVKFGTLEFVLKECDFGKHYNFKKLETALNQFNAKNKFQNMKFLVDQPIYNPSLDEIMNKRKEFISDLGRTNFKERSFQYTSFLVSNEECKFVSPPPVSINENYKDVNEIKILETKEVDKIDKFLGDMLLPNSNTASLIAKTPLFVELLCRNDDIIVNFSEKHFEKMMDNFNPDDSKSKTLFLNQIFRSTLNVNMKSTIPAFILSRSHYCKYLTCESFAFLGFYSKKVSKIDIHPHGLQDVQKEIHKQKIESMTTLRMEENQYFSTRSCKESLLELIDNKWKLIKLRPPDFFYDNDIFIFASKKFDRKMRNSKEIQNSINEFYSNIREAIKDFELASLDDFYGNFLLNLIANLPNLKDVNVSNLNLGDKFCEGFNNLVATERKKRGEYRFINLEILNNIRITNVGMKFLYVSFQIMRNYFRNKGFEVLPKLKMFSVYATKKKKTYYSSPIKFFSRSNKDKLIKVSKKYKKVRVKKGTLSKVAALKKNAAPSEKLSAEIDALIEDAKEKQEEMDKRGREEEKDPVIEYEEIELTDEEETKNEAIRMESLLEKEEQMKALKLQEEQKKLEEKVNLELSKKNLDETNETIILNEGLGMFLQFYIKGLTRPKRFFCYNCDSEVCKECHKLHHKFKECEPDFIICEKCNEIHHKDLVDCKLESEDQIICRGFRQILQEKKENMVSRRFARFFRKKRDARKNECAVKCESCITFIFMFGVWGYYKLLEMTKNCVMAIRRQFEKCFVGRQSTKGEHSSRQLRCLECLNCFFGDPDTIDDEVKEFKFNRNVIELNHSLGRKQLVLLYSMNFIIYYFLAGFLPIYFRGIHTVKWESHYLYGCYAAVVFLFESYLTYFIIRTVNQGKGNKILKDFSLANYVLPLFLSQIKKYDFYTDVVFIITNLNEQREHIAIISGSFLVVTTFMNLVMILSLLIALWNLECPRIFCCQRRKDKDKVHNFSRNNSGVENAAPALGPDTFQTFLNVKKIDNEASNQNINLFCKLSSLLELECIGNCLDKFSTKNAWYFPYFGGYYIPQQIISSLLKFCFEDIPSFVIQVFVIAYYDSNGQIASLLPIIITTCFSLVASVTTVLTAKASILQSNEVKLLENEKFVIKVEEEGNKDETLLLENKKVDESERLKENMDHEEKKKLMFEEKKNDN